MDTTRSDAVLGRTFTTLVVLIGPYVTALIITSQNASNTGNLFIWLGLIAWSPLFFSVPALLTQDGRDKALPALDGMVGSLLRGIILLPWLVLSPKSTIRVETIASLVGFMAAVLHVLPYM